MTFYLDDEKVSIDELIKRLKLDPKSIPHNKREKEFEQNMERDSAGNPKRSQADGRYDMTRKISCQPAFTVFVEKLGVQVKIRVADTQIKEKDSEYKYLPNIIFMDPGEDGSYTMSDPTEFVFWFLHPWNKHSPFRDKNKVYFYEYKDGDARSKAGNDLEEAKINALSIIVGRSALSISKLRSLAKGFGVAGVEDMSDDVVKAKLRELANADPIGFTNKADSREIVFSGMIQDAIDKKILVLDTKNGIQRWYLGGDEILPIGYGTDPMEQLLSHMAENFHLYAKQIQDALTGMDLEKSLKNEKNDQIFEDLKAQQAYQPVWPDDVQAVLDKMQKEEWFDTKIKKLAAIPDPNDPSVHFQTRKSYEDNKAAVEAYKSTLPTADPVV